MSFEEMVVALVGAIGAFALVGYLSAKTFGFIRAWRGLIVTNQVMMMKLLTGWPKLSLSIKRTRNEEFKTWKLLLPTVRRNQMLRFPKN